MKRYIEVSKHVSGRTITQRYPARVVGEVLWDLPYCEPMACIGGCGYIRCSQTGPCAPKPVAPESPDDALPEGWSPSDEEDYRHVSGAYVWQGKSSGYWYAERTGVPNDQTFYTRDEAMAAALASAQPDTKRREPGCQCHMEEGDSPCAVHDVPAEPTLPYRFKSGEYAGQLITDVPLEYLQRLSDSKARVRVLDEVIAELARRRAQPTLHAGWTPSNDGETHWRNDWTAWVQYKTARNLGTDRPAWAVYVPPGNSTPVLCPTLESAQLMAEELAGAS